MKLEDHKREVVTPSEVISMENVASSNVQVEFKDLLNIHIIHP